MNDEPPAIWVIGNANLDLVAGSVSDWPAWGTEVFLSRSDFRVGGSAANTAVVLQRLGQACGLVSARGDDDAGEMIARRFCGPLDRVAALPKRTSISVGILQQGGERSFFSTEGHLDDLDAEFFRGGLEGAGLEGSLALVSGVFAMPGLIPGHSGLLDWLRARGAEIAIDPGWPGDGWTEQSVDLARDWIAKADHLLFNEMEITGLTAARDVDTAIAQIGEMLRLGARLVVKSGPEGASLLRGSVVKHASAPRLDIIDTVGAGDAFNAGYLAAIANGLDDEAAIRSGISAAGHVISEFPRGSAPIAVT
jgi:sugar/nucleoside kinase (ribokinase family)